MESGRPGRGSGCAVRHSRYASSPTRPLTRLDDGVELPRNGRRIGPATMRSSSTIRPGPSMARFGRTSIQRGIKLPDSKYRRWFLSRCCCSNMIEQSDTSRANSGRTPTFQVCWTCTRTHSTNSESASPSTPSASFAGFLRRTTANSHLSRTPFLSALDYI